MEPGRGKIQNAKRKGRPTYAFASGEERRRKERGGNKGITSWELRRFS